MRVQKNLYKPTTRTEPYRIIECPIREGRRRYETIVESWRNLQSFRARWPGLLAEALIYITDSLSLSFVSSTQLLLYPCSSAVKGRGCWLRSKEGKGRGEAEEGFDGIDESLSFLFLSSTKGARFSSLFEPSKHGTTPLGADAKGYPPLSLFLLF